MLEFVIHDLPLADGEVAITPMPGRTRHYQADWERLIVWAPDLVLTMTTQAELDRKGAGTLGADLANAGIAWLHLPVADFGVPDDLDFTDPELSDDGTESSPRLSLPIYATKRTPKFSTASTATDGRTSETRGDLGGWPRRKSKGLL